MIFSRGLSRHLCKGWGEGGKGEGLLMSWF